MIIRFIIFAGIIVAFMLGGPAYVLIFLAVSFAVFLLAAALHRGWYR